MVIKGGSRSGPGELAYHLLRTDTNEAVRVWEMDGLTGRTLRAGLMEMEAVGSGSRSRLPLYHASINIGRDEAMTEPQKVRAIDRLAEELGLTGQPRAIVEHVKEGREHLHVVWSRIDGETLKAIPDSHNYRRHEIVARELEREFSLQRVQGVHVERDGIERPARTPEPFEMMAAARTGLQPAEAKAEITGLWQMADSGRAFADALDDAGWTLARGDKRDFVVLDRYGEAHSLARRVEGVKAAEIRARMADIDPAGLPSVDEARQAIQERQLDAVQPVPVPSMDSPTADLSMPTPEPQQPGQLHQLDDAPQLVPQAVPVPVPVQSYGLTVSFAMVPDAPKVQPVPVPEIDARQAQGPTLKMGGMDIPAPLPEAPQRASYEAEPEVKTPDVGRLAGIIAAARERLAALGERLDIAFGRVRDQVLKAQPKSRPTPEITKPADRARSTGQGRDMDNGAVILEAMKQPPAPEPKRSRSVAEELLEAGRRHREQNPKPELDRDDIGPRRRRMPWEPPL